MSVVPFLRAAEALTFLHFMTPSLRIQAHTFAANLDQSATEAGHPWYAVRVRSRCEKVAAAAFRSKGFEEFPALYSTRQRWSDRYKDVELPLFPGYVFCRFDALRRMPILTTPGVVSIVGFNGIPMPIDEAEIAAVQAIIRSGLPAKPWPFLKVGERVLVEYGSMTGLEGHVVRVMEKWRLVISVNMLQRSVAVEIERDWVRPI